MRTSLRRTTRLIIAMLFGFVLMACREEQGIREKLLKDTPTGTSFEEVKAFCAKSKFKCANSTTAGYLNQDTGQVIGVSSIWAVIDERKSMPMLTTSISAYWGFDKEKKLVDIWVWKTIDGP